ncbi:TonB system transport protein ExbD [Helicobacter heilmannii]|uniref:Biopolymer transport protein ExbD n=1 Tax=Helicobacter heilmannii TaxID=35817 RepID=A0A0K2XXM5_HELHE|nr:TonB system transport protein ExbD [Helicobacter heilmannii]CCM12220.1 Biopolymer transport protein ExbD/TolR [Helicobacter heilmannii ASB1.4]CRF46543.1 Biopolymer transport protein ExbD/TolR [Helicobacter heilmannii]CRF47959.1 Biopolymer transport protein ExbD/TolR [Helicobacter heilmannii]CRF50264.1 Biopolymer transport protein ExbD/TolR [Helicobacter heilmannii]CRI34153.1 Biopolymer transport protein ExbD/TolR [Helicobacter heilmannii]
MRSKLRRGDGLNIVPFIDVMLVLLALVLSVSTFIAEGKIKVNLPSASSAQKAPPQEKKVTIVVDKNDGIFVDDKPKSVEELRALIKSLDSKTLVDLRSDKDSKFGTFIEIIDILKDLNHENFSISTEKK